MNYMQITYLLKAGVTWNSVDVTNFIEYLHTNSLYSGRYNIVPPVPSIVDVNVIVYCKSWANLDVGNSSATSAITALFDAAGLNYDIMLTDISQAIMASYSGIDYVDIVSPAKDAIVSTPWIPAPALAQQPSGTLAAGSVTYSIGYISNTGATVAGKNLAYLVLPSGNSSVMLTWPAVASATQYLIYGRGGIGSTWGLIATIPANASNPVYLDDGHVVPVPVSTNSTTLPYNVVAYNQLGNLTVKTYYTQRSGSAQG